MPVQTVLPVEDKRELSEAGYRVLLAARVKI
jgi:hypothetical protein